MKKLLLTALFILMTFTATFAQVSDHTPKKGKVLVVLSSENAITLQDGKTYKTGYFLNELTVPVKRLMEEGYSITFANPKGNRPSMDSHSDSIEFFGKDSTKYKEVKAFHDNLVNLKSPRRLQEVVQEGLSQYDAVFFPGGHAPMQDLIKDSAVRQVLLHFHQAGKPTALICHAPIALIAAMPQAEAFVEAMKQGDLKEAEVFSSTSQQKDLKQAAAPTQSWIYKGYRMTIFSTSEEKVAESKQLGGKMLFYPEAALRSAGGDVRVTQPWSSQVMQDRELITGQNPFSDDALAKTLSKAIERKKAAN